MPGRLWSLDVLRGLCAAIVFLSHWHLWSNFPPQTELERLVHRALEICHDTLALLTWPTGGHHPAVLGFFVLSGFCIHYPFERRWRNGEPEPSWRDYLFRRARRILPVYWAACLLGLVFVFAQTHHPAPSSLLGLHASGTFWDTIFRFAGLSGIYPREVFAGNYILTTVTVEIIMYAVYPLFFHQAVRGHWTGLGVVFVVGHLLAVALLLFVTPYWVFNSILMLGAFWFLGALAAHLFLTGRGHVPALWIVGAWTAFLWLKSLAPFYGLNLLKQAVWGAICTLGILWAVNLEQRRPTLAQHRVVPLLRRVGDISYSLYAMHTPAIMLASWSLLHLGVQSYFAQLAATLVASLGAVLLVHVAIERKFYRPHVSASSFRAPARD